MAEREPRISGAALKLLRYLLVNATDEDSGAAISKATQIGAGTLYPLLARLEKAGWITGQWENADPSEIGRPRRRFYKLTGIGATRGRAALASYQIPNYAEAQVWNT